MSLTNCCPFPPLPPHTPTGTNKQPCTMFARGQELMAGFKLNSIYLEGHQWQLRTHCNFFAHHHSSLPWKTNIFPSWGSLPKKTQIPGEKVTARYPKRNQKKQYENNYVTISLTEPRSFLAYLIITKPVITQKHTLSDDLSVWLRYKHYLLLMLSGSGKGNVNHVLPPNGLWRITTFQRLTRRRRRESNYVVMG